MCQANYSKKLIEKAFSLLELELSQNLLQKENGKYRKAKVSEFMFMHLTQKYFAFKHRYTRNYLFVNRLTGELYVPATKDYFLKGYFDNFTLIYPKVSIAIRF